jgi:N-acetylglucosamine transport system substrate-binding protein
MTTEKRGLDRRTFLRGAFAAAVAVPITVSLASCSSDNGSGGGGGTKSASNPFGIKDSSNIEAVIFNGGYGYDYVTFAAKLVDKKWKTKSKVTPQTNIAQSLQPRFVGGNPPDLIDNSGANQIGFNTILKSLETLDDVFEANNYEGKKIADTLYPGVKTPGTFSNKFVAMNYVMTVYAIWYSATLFEENGWTPPKTWDEALDLGAKAKAKGKYLFVWGKEAATYYLTMALDSAIKEGGLDVMNAVNNLEKNAWSQKPIQDVFAALEKIVAAGYFVPGGAGTQFTAAQAKWSNDQQAILYPRAAGSRTR